MIVGTGFENKTNEPTCFPRGIGRSKHGINRYVYIYIGHKSCVGVCFRGEMLITSRRVAPCCLFFPFPPRWRVGF